MLKWSISPFPQPAQAIREFGEGDSGYFIIEALRARGISYRYVRDDEVTIRRFLSRAMITFELGGVAYYYDSKGRLSLADPKGENVPGPIIDGSAAYQVTQKGLTNAVLRQHGIRVPNGTTLSSQAKGQAALFFSALSPEAKHGLCVKPTASMLGRGVHVGIKSLHDFQAAFLEIGKRYDHILIEETVPGTVYRLLCLADRVIAIRYGVPANVMGDGIHSIVELVAIKNATRKCYPIRIGRNARMLLKKACYRLDDVPMSGAIVWLGETSNFYQGGDVGDATDDVHPSYIALAEKAVSAFPGLVLCGVDMAMEDPSALACDNYHVLELNCCPGLSAHYNPGRGEIRPVAEAIIDYLSRKGPNETAVVPALSITRD